MENKSTSDKISLELENTYKKIDNYFLNSLWLNNGIALALALLYQNWWISLIGASFLNISTILSFYYSKKRSFKTYSLAILFCFWSALFMIQTNGILEIRYIYFCYVFLTALYQNPFLLIVCFFISFFFTVGFFFPLLQEEHEWKFIASYFLEPQNATFERLGITVFAEILVCGAGFLYATLLKTQNQEALERKIKNETSQEQIKKDIIIAKEIANGNFSVKVEVSENDALSQALEDMRHNLLVAAEKEKQDKYINIGIAEISHTLRIQYKDTNELCKALINQLVKYLKANQGAIFILHEDKEEVFLQLEACYAYDKNRFVAHQKIKAGEGLVGQVLLEKMPTYLSNIPSNYVRITSGLGEATPRYLILMPLLNNNEQMAGVIEIASFYPIAPHEQEFLQKAAESIAITINSTQIAEKTKLLLRETQAQAEQMQAQEEEMRQNMEELMATQEEMERKNNEIRSWFDSLNNSHIGFFVLSNEGKIEQVNQSLLQILGRKEEDIVHGSIKKLCWNENECHKLEKSIQDIQQDNIQNYNIIITFKSKEEKAIHLDCSLIPIQNYQGEAIGIRVFATNITTIKENEQRINELLKSSNKKNLENNQLREKTEKMLTEMQGKLNALDMAKIGIMEFKVNSAVLSVNKMLQEFLEYPEEILYKKKLKDLLEVEFNETEQGKNLWTEIRNQKNKQDNLILITSSGQRLETNIQFCTVYDSEGLPLKIVGIIKNIKKL